MAAAELPFNTVKGYSLAQCDPIPRAQRYENCVAESKNLKFEPGGEPIVSPSADWVRVPMRIKNTSAKPVSIHGMYSFDYPPWTPLNDVRISPADYSRATTGGMWYSGPEVFPVCLKVVIAPQSVVEWTEFVSFGDRLVAEELAQFKLGFVACRDPDSRRDGDNAHTVWSETITVRHSGDANAKK